MTWLYYLLEANLYLAICYGFYLVFLQKETFYGLNRAYLICSSLLSFVIPLLRIGSLNQIFNDRMDLDLVYMDPNLGRSSGNLTFVAFEGIVTGVYLVIAAYFSIQLLISLYRVLALASKARRRRFGDMIYLELDDTQTAFSFFNLLFLNPSSAEKDTILKHELVHIQQKHSLDILFFELLKILNWFNPIVWLMQQDVKLLHEYIADDLTTRRDVQKHAYAMFLIQNSFGVKPIYLTNQIFNPSILKRRISMLNRKRSAGRARLKLLLAVPLVGGMLFASTVAFSKEYALVDLYPEQHIVEDDRQSSRRTLQDPLVQEVRSYRLNHKMDSKGKRVVKYDNRLVVINGNSSQSGVIMQVQGFDKMVELNASEAKAKYGDRGASGALEFTGKKTKTLGLRDDVRFPPPIVKKTMMFPPPPPAEPAPPASSKSGVKGKTNLPKNGEVRFPPPIVKPEKKEVPPPPPPVEPTAQVPEVEQPQQGW
jgi:hypothetical protein